MSSNKAKKTDMPLLLEADKIINVDRADSYGPALSGFNNVADQWSLYLKQKYNIDLTLAAEDVCWMMADLKKVRQAMISKRDNVLDAAGYIGLIEQVTDLK